MSINSMSFWICCDTFQHLRSVIRLHSKFDQFHCDYDASQKETQVDDCVLKETIAIGTSVKTGCQSVYHCGIFDYRLYEFC